MRTRKIFNKEFKLAAVKLLTERGMTCAQAARDLDIGQNVVSRWARGLSPALHPVL